MVPPIISVVANVLLFILVTALASSVEFASISQRGAKICRGVTVAMACQFFLLPGIGFLTVRACDLERVDGIMLLIVVSSPGGAYSNWLCSVFNADLALSVAATALSTVLSMGLLPLNLLLYLRATYGAELIGFLRWDLLLVSLAVIALAVIVGLLISRHLGRVARADKGRAALLRVRLAAAGNLAGLSLIIFSAIFSSVTAPLWDKPGIFYVAVATPVVIALLLASLLTALPCLRLSRPERVAIVIEAAFQNTGVATSIAFSVFRGSDASRAAGTPLFYGVCLTLLLPLYATAAWRLGWTYAPPKDPCWRMLTHSYQERSTGDGASAPERSHGGTGDDGVPRWEGLDHAMDIDRAEVSSDETTAACSRCR